LELSQKENCNILYIYNKQIELEYVDWEFQDKEPKNSEKEVLREKWKALTQPNQ